MSWSVNGSTWLYARSVVEASRWPELATLPELVEEIEVAGVSAGPAELAAGIRELIEHLRVQAAAIVTLADRLERIAPPG